MQLKLPNITQDLAVQLLMLVVVNNAQDLLKFMSESKPAQITQGIDRTQFSMKLNPGRVAALCY